MEPHPYKEFEALEVWKALTTGINDLVANRDIEEKTARPYIVGYLIKILADSDLLRETGSDRVGPIIPKKSAI